MKISLIHSQRCFDNLLVRFASIKPILFCITNYVRLAACVSSGNFVLRTYTSSNCTNLNSALELIRANSVDFQQ